MYVSTQHKGFTLLELMITVAVIGILAAISIPSYTSHMIKVRRATATACLMEGAQYAERHYTTNMKYEGATDKIAELGCAKDINDNGNGHYTISGTDTDKTYTLTATPINRQLAKDTKCGVLKIDHTGQKFADGAVNECW